MSVELHHGDCLEVLRALPDNSIDSIVTDPPYGLGFMGKEWDDLPPGKPWATECLRVLKPGGHLLAFGGTRTSHRLACAIEDAGFEIRDSIAWLYGSGFPKSLDVSKAIDKAAGAEREVVAVRADFAAKHAAETSRGASNARGYNETHDPGRGGYTNPQTVGQITAPATDAARTWQGFGTALKPAFEPVVVARKPLSASGVNVLNAVELSLQQEGVEGEIRWTNAPANGVAKLAPATNSSSTRPQSTAGTSADHVAASETLNDARRTANGSETSTPLGERPTVNTSGPTSGVGMQSFEPKSSTPTEVPAPVATSGPGNSSPSTTSTAAAQPTGKQPGERSTPKSSASDSQTVTESFAGIATGLSGSWATVRIDKLSDGTYVWPDGLPRSTPGGSTVAANVLQHGTGALNVDGCRVESGARPLIISKSEDSTGILGNGLNGSSHAGSTTAGRWPANVALDEEMAAALDEQSGVLHSQDPATRASKSKRQGVTQMGTGASVEYADKGGASRFFYVAKAPKSERPTVDGIAHPTVKPLALMRWLVRLVTPPGGVVLEPFAGSGTTVEAALLEGFRVVAIEREADYLPLIEARIARVAARAAQVEPDLFTDDTKPPGRWPPNVVMDRSQAEVLDEQSGILHSQDPRTRYRAKDPSWSPSGTPRGDHGVSKQETGADKGGASRFFPIFDEDSEGGAA